MKDAAEDSSKQGRKISDIDTDPTISLVQPQQDMEYDFDATASIILDASKAKDKGKSIMQESKPPKKIKKRFQVQMSVDEELVKKLDEREEVAAKEAHDNDWSDPFVLRYHALQNRPFSVAEVRRNMCMVSKESRIQSFVPMDSEKEKGSEKKTGGRRKKSLARKRAKETLSEEMQKQN
ncbi:hypothetical protein Tco_1506061 [Tanacetum coccineum]